MPTGFEIDNHLKNGISPKVIQGHGPRKKPSPLAVSGTTVLIKNGFYPKSRTRFPDFLDLNLRSLLCPNDFTVLLSLLFPTWEVCF